MATASNRGLSFNPNNIMIKALTSYLDYSIFAELSVVIFAVVFVAVVIRTVRIKKEIADHHANIVLGDQTENRP